LAPFFLTLLLIWFLVEFSLAVWNNPDFQPLAGLIWLVILAVALTVTVSPKVPWKEAMKQSRPADSFASVSLLFWNAGLIAVVMFLADLWTPRVTFVTPLLKFYQVLYKIITGTQ
jgi:hypothetical protein